MDTNGNGYLTLTEIQGGLPLLLERDAKRKIGGRTKVVMPICLKPAIKCAFNAARFLAVEEKQTKPKLKRKKTKALAAKGLAKRDLVDLREFHAMLVAFKYYLELDVMFSKLDSTDDRILSWKEVNKPACLGLLEQWNITPEMARPKFLDDEWAPSLKFEDFAEWCIVRRFGSFTIPLVLDENDPEETMKDAAGGDASAIGKVLKAFEEWDEDGSGTISEEELTRVMQKLDPKFTEAMAASLFAAADANQDGKVDYIEFVHWLTA